MARATLARVITHLDADPESGLSTSEARRRLARVGPNRVRAQTLSRKTRAQPVQELTVALGPDDWLLLAIGALWPVTLIELGKMIRMNASRA